MPTATPSGSIASFVSTAARPIEFKDRKPIMRDNEQATFIHMVWRNEHYVPGAIGPRGKLWSSCVVSPDKRDFHQQRMGTTNCRVTS
jgi:hypothetical protein